MRFLIRLCSSWQHFNWRFSSRSHCATDSWGSCLFHLLTALVTVVWSNNSARFLDINIYGKAVFRVQRLLGLASVFSVRCDDRPRTKMTCPSESCQLIPKCKRNHVRKGLHQVSEVTQGRPRWRYLIGSISVLYEWSAVARSRLAPFPRYYHFHSVDECLWHWEVLQHRYDYWYDSCINHSYLIYRPSATLNQTTHKRCSSRKFVG